MDTPLCSSKDLETYYESREKFGASARRQTPGSTTAPVAPATYYFPKMSTVGITPALPRLMGTPNPSHGSGAVGPDQLTLRKSNRIGIASEEEDLSESTSKTEDEETRSTQDAVTT